MFFIENRLSTADMKGASRELARNHKVIGAAFHTVIDAWQTFASEAVVPICGAWKNPTPREFAFIGLFYRMHWFAKTVVRLTHVAHFQSLVSAERSIIELYLDVELLHRNVLPNGVERFTLFIQLQKLKSAQRADRFFREKPHLDAGGRSAEPQRDFIARFAANLEADRARVFVDGKGRAYTPEHWTEKAMPDRAALLDEDSEYLVASGYDVRNFAVHTGLAGLVGLDLSGLEKLCTLSRGGIANCLLKSLPTLNAELSLESRIPKYQRVIDTLSELHVMSIIDRCLQAQGAPSRVVIHRGTDWSTT